MRPSKDSVWLRVAREISDRGTCGRRRVGCVLVDKLGHVLSTGYNGVGAGLPHCSDSPCPGVACPSGEGLDKCEAIHAEQNALLQCRDVQAIDTCYVTVSPCVHCVKLLLNTSCKRIVFSGLYAHAKEAEVLWTKAHDDLLVYRPGSLVCPGYIESIGRGSIRKWVHHG